MQTARQYINDTVTTEFDDTEGALEEAQFIADRERQAVAIIQTNEDKLIVVPVVDVPGIRKAKVLEWVTPTYDPFEEVA